MKRAVVLAGGKGSRLAPYTIVFPKPLMPLDDTPILEIILRQLARYGFDQVTLAVGHLAELIEAFFGDGQKMGLRLDYVREAEPLGTAGPLATLGDVDEDVLVMNGDILSSLDYCRFLDEHVASGAQASIATYLRQNRVDFGVVETDALGRVTGYIEKPVTDYRVSMGVYAFSPEAVGFVRPGEHLDFPDLVLRMLDQGLLVRSVPFDGYWLDIGRHEDFAQAQAEFSTRRSELLGD